MDLCFLILVACIGYPDSEIPIQGLGVDTPASTAVEEVFPNQRSTELSVNQARFLARSITVKVKSANNWGSGILIQQQGQVYTVLTNKHVLTDGEPYQIEAPDGRVYLADLSKSVRGGNDLALLHFRSLRSYAIAYLGTVTSLAEGDEVFAAGFPFAMNPGESKGFVFTTGKAVLRLDQALIGGYQVGYSNEIQQGMSGGPILNRQGEVVGINGMHKYPLWGDPYIYKDGSKPHVWMRSLMAHLSWGIPVETFAQLVPRFSCRASSQPPNRTQNQKPCN